MNTGEPYLILGIGNCLLSDDGVGVHAARLLEAEPPPKTVVLAAETDFLSALPFFERCTKVLVIDAMDASQPPGTLYRCRSEDLAATGQRHSLHELGLSEVLEFLDAGHRPEVHILGVQPGRIGLALDLSPAVAAALSQVVQAARQIVAEFISSSLEDGRCGASYTCQGKRKVARREGVAASSEVFGAWRWRISRAQDHRQGLRP